MIEKEQEENYIKNLTKNFLKNNKKVVDKSFM